MVKQKLKTEKRDDDTIQRWIKRDCGSGKFMDKTSKIDNSYSVFWSEDDNCFICQGKKQPDVIGIGETEEEAVKTYFELLEEYLKDNKIRNLAKRKGGRPKKSNAKLVYNVPHEIKAFIELEAARNEVNQGVIVEKIVKFYQEANKQELSKYYEFL